MNMQETGDLDRMNIQKVLRIPGVVPEKVHKRCIWSGEDGD